MQIYDTVLLITEYEQYLIHKQKFDIFNSYLLKAWCNVCRFNLWINFFLWKVNIIGIYETASNETYIIPETNFTYDRIRSNIFKAYCLNTNCTHQKYILQYFWGNLCMFNQQLILFLNDQLKQLIQTLEGLNSSNIVIQLSTKKR